MLPLLVAAELLGIRGLDAATFEVDPWLAWAQVVLLLAAFVPAVLTRGGGECHSTMAPASSPRAK